MTQAEEFETGHLDRVTVLHVNFDGTRILTGSIDHRIKVWDRDTLTGQKTLLDTFTAHDADIRDAKWLHPTTGSHLATIGNDLRFRLWQEDPSQPPNSGRRFRKIAQIPSSARVPFVSLDLKNVDSVYTYLALIDRQGLLSVFEPTNPDEFKEWTVVDQWPVCVPPPGRGEETSFKVRFDQNPINLPYMNNLSDDKRMLSIVVTAMNRVHIFRSAPGNENNSNSNSKPLSFYSAAIIPVHPALVRDVQWALFNVRGTDLIATACKDGSIRIYQIDVTSATTNHTTAESTTAGNGALDSTAGEFSRKQASQPNRPQQQSSLTTAIAGRKSTNPGDLMSSEARQSVAPSPRIHPAAAAAVTRPVHHFPFKHEVTLAATLESAHSDAWAIAWDPNGQVLMSSGADGVTKLWKKSIVNGQWLLFADQALDFGDDTSESEVESGAEA